MAFDGNNVFNRVHDFTDDAANSIAISSSRVDAEFDGIATGLGQCLTRAGEAAMTGPLDLNGQNIVLDADGDTKIAAGTDDVVDVTVGGSASRLLVRQTYLDGPALAVLMRGHVSGLVLSNDTSTDFDINITAGATSDTTAAAIIKLPSEITKAIDATWTLGDDGGGMDVGTRVASTMYAVWLIQRSDTLVVDAIFSASFTWSGVTKTLITDYDRAQLIGAVWVKANQEIAQFTQFGDHFQYDESINAYSGGPAADETWETITFDACPPSSLVEANGYVSSSITTDTSHMLQFRPTTGAQAENATRALSVGLVGGDTYVNSLAGMVRIGVDGSSQVDMAATENSGTTTVQVTMEGFRMVTRGNGT